MNRFESVIEGTKALIELQQRRRKLGLNPVCITCGRVMKTKRKSKTSGEYHCKCNPDLALSVG